VEQEGSGMTEEKAIRFFIELKEHLDTTTEAGVEAALAIDMAIAALIDWSMDDDLGDI